MGKKSVFLSPWFSIAVTLFASIMFIRYLVPALNTDSLTSYLVELIIWLAMALVFFVRFLLQLKSKHSRESIENGSTE